MKLVLGTAQLGMKYGVANTGGQITLDSAREILDFAKTGGIKTLDTAIAYGESEKVLGRVGVNDFNVISKLPAMPDDVSDVYTWMKDQVHWSLDRLNIERLHALLLHRPLQLTEKMGTQLLESLSRLKQDGDIEKAGVSIYSPEELARILPGSGIDIVQSPLNLVDRRLITSGWLNKLKQMSIEVHTRSAFLQGLLLMPAGKVPAYFDRWNIIWNKWQEWLSHSSLTAAQACLVFVNSVPGVDSVVVGVDNLQHLKEQFESIKLAPAADWPEVSSEDEMLVNPANWNL